MDIVLAVIEYGKKPFFWILSSAFLFGLGVFYSPIVQKSGEDNWRPACFFWTVGICLILVSCILIIKNKRKYYIPKDKIGIILSINSEKRPNSETELKRDFVHNFTETLKNSSSYFYILESDKIFKEKFDKCELNSKERHDFLEKVCNRPKLPVYVLHGDFLCRKDKGKDVYYLDLKSTINFKGQPSNQKEIIHKLFNESVQPSTKIDVHNELDGFKISVDHYSLSAKHILLVLLRNLGVYDACWEILYSIEQPLPNIKKNRTVNFISKSIQNIKIDLVHSHSFSLYHNNDIEGCRNVLNRLPDYSCYRLDIIRSIIAYKDHDLKKAFNLVHKYEKGSGKDATWALNCAFIKGVNGDLQQSYRYYQKVLNLKFSDAIFETEEFMYKELNANPALIQLYYLLGLINYMFKDDYSLAIENFAKFLERDRSKSFINHHKYAVQYIEKAKEKLT